MKFPTDPIRKQSESDDVARTLERANILIRERTSRLHLRGHIVKRHSHG
jgi:hypothetical protein